MKKRRKRNNKFDLDNINLEIIRFETLRLPPYHPELNPIQNIWGIIKNRIALKT
jgi:transposase